MMFSPNKPAIRAHSRRTAGTHPLIPSSSSVQLRATPWLIFLFLLLPALPLSAQSTADEIESLLETSAVTYAQAARFILQAADVTVTDSRWFEYAAKKNWLPKNVSANDTARLDGIALLVMRSFNMKGGIMYSILRNPHYAYRELVYQEIIQGRADPAMPVDGGALLYIAGSILTQMEEEN